MKKCVSWILTLAMLLSLLPGAAFGAEPEAAEPETLTEAETLPPAQRMEAPEPYVPEKPRLSEDDGDVELMAGNCTVSGTVSLPGGAKAESNGFLYVYLYTQPVLDENGMVLSEPQWAAGARVTFDKGETSGSFTFSNVEPGSYILRTYSWLHTAGALSDERYYNADGSVAANAYAAIPLKLTSGSTRVNLTLPKAERSISGTLTFDTPAPKDTVIDLSAINQSRGRWLRYSAEIPVEKGATSVGFSIGVEQGNYYLQFRNDETDAYGYAGLYDVVNDKWDQRMYINTVKASVTGLRQNGTALLPGSQGSGEENPLTVTVIIPAAQTQEKEYMVSVFDEDGYERDSRFCEVQPGETSLAAQFDGIGLEQGEAFYVGYADVTGCNNYWSESEGIRYTSPDGITTMLERASVFTVGEDTQVTIQEPECFAVTGTVTRASGVAARSAAYVFADFWDGESYAGRAVFQAGEESARYTIYVPKSQQGEEFSTYAGLCKSGTGNQVQESTLCPGADYTLTGTMQLEEFVLGQGEPTVYGYVSLPQGMTAPESGLVVEMGTYQDYNEERCATYYLPAGESGFHYALVAPVEDETTVYAQLENAPEGLYYRVEGIFDEEQLTEADLTLLESLTLSGEIAVPESCREGKATIQVYAEGSGNGNTFYEDTYVGIVAGEVTSYYELRIPKGNMLNRVCFRVRGDSQNALDTTAMYLQEDGTLTSKFTQLHLFPKQDLVFNVTLSRGRFLSGTLSLAEGMSEGTYRGRIEVSDMDGNWLASSSFNFNGASSNYKLSLPDTATGPVRVSLTVYEGTGTITYKNFYYSTEGWTTDQNKATPVTVGEEGLVLDLTLPKAKIISGQFVSPDGGAVKWDPQQSVNMYLESESGSQQNFRASVDAQGNWTISVDSSFTGTYRLRANFYGSGVGNIVRGGYYYSDQAQAVTDMDQAGTLTLGASDMTGVKLYVETGWMITGSLVFPEGGYLTGGSMQLYFNARGTDYRDYSGSGELNEDGGRYCIVVPKTEDTYTIQLNSNTPGSHISTNLCITEQKIENVAVNGDTKGPSFTLEKAKAIITGTVYRPEGSSDYVSFDVYLKAGDTWKQPYYTWVSIQSDEDSGTFSIPVPESEEAETFQLYYCGWGSNMPEGTVQNKEVYLCQDGSLTTDFTQAGNFPMKDIHFAFTLLESEPFARGKVYLPEGMTDSAEIAIEYSPWYSDLAQTLDGGLRGQLVFLDPDDAQTDSSGRKYVTYALSDPEMTAGMAYLLRYYVEYDNSGMLALGYDHYLDRNGSVMNWQEAKAEPYYVPEYGANIVDFTPLTWSEGSADYVLQSAHGVDASLLGTLTYTYTYPAEAESLTLTFSSRTDLDLVINGEEYFAYNVSGREIEVSGNTVTIGMTVDPWMDGPRYGFAVESIVVNDAQPLPEPTPAAIYTGEGSKEADVISGLQQGQPVQVTLVNDGYLGRDTTVVGVIYDEKGKMLEFVRVPVDLNNNSDTAQLLFEEYGRAVTLKILLTDGDWNPEMVNRTISGR